MIKPCSVCWVKLPEKLEDNSSVQAGTRPCIVLANRSALMFQKVLTVIPLTSRVNKAKRIPSHVILSNLKKESIALVEQIQTVPRSSVDETPIYSLNADEKKELKEALSLQFGI